MLSVIYPFHRIAAVAVLLVIGSWLARSHTVNGVGVADNLRMAAADVEGAVVRSSRPLMGTIFNVSVWAEPGSQPQAAEANQYALDRVASVEEKISSWNSASDTSAVNRSAGKEAIPIGSDLHDLLDTSLLWARRTDGAFDITGGPLFDLWNQARKERILPTEEEIHNCLEFVGHDQVILEKSTARLEKPGMKIGFGAIGKGYAAAFFDALAVRLQRT